MDKHKIIYFEEKDAPRRKMSRQLRSFGFSVSEVSTLKTALDRIQQNKRDAIIFGAEKLSPKILKGIEKVKHTQIDLPVILLMGRGSSSDIGQAVTAGAAQFLLKSLPSDYTEMAILQTVEMGKIGRRRYASQDTLWKVSENVPDVIYSLNLKGEFISISPSVGRAMGYKPAELIGTSAFEIIHPDDRSKVRQSYLNSAETLDSKVKVLQFRMRSKKGEYRHFEIRRRMVIENGQLIRSDGIAQDITYRIELEEKLRTYHEDMAQANIDMYLIQDQLTEKNVELERIIKEKSKDTEKLHAMIDTSPYVLLFVDNNDIIRTANRNVSLFFGLKLKDIIDLPFDEFIKKIKDTFDDQDGLLKMIEQLSKKHDPRDGIDMEEVLKRGLSVSKYKQGILAPMSNRIIAENKMCIGRLWIFADISHFKRAATQVHAIVNASPIPTIISSLGDGRVLYANEELAKLVGLTTKELIGQVTPDFYYDLEDRKHVVETLMRDGVLNNFETRIKSVDGSVVWMIFSLVTTQMEGETVILGWLYDISERKKSEEVIAARLKYEKALAGCSQALLTEAKSEDALTTALNHLLDASGSSRVYIFEKFDDLDLGSGMRMTKEAVEPGMKKKKGVLSEQLAVCSEGFERWHRILSQGGPIHGLVETFPECERGVLEKEGILSILVLPLWVNGEWFGFIGFDEVKKRREWNDEDVRLLKTASEMIGCYFEIKKADLALRASEARFRGFVEKANDIIYALTPEGVFSYVSPNWTEILGHEISEVEGNSFAPFVHPDDLSAAEVFFKKVMIEGKKMSGIEYRVKHKTDGWKWHRSSAAPLKDESGNVVRYIGVAHDFTPMKNMLEDLEKTNRELKDTQAALVQSEKMASLGSLVAGIAHEINTPIGAVSSMYDTLSRTLVRLEEAVEKSCSEEYQNSSKLQSYFKVIESSNKVIRSGTERVTTIVRRLKSFARLDEAEIKTVDIHEGLEDTLTLVHHEIKHSITIQRDYGDIPLISCYPGQLNQVFLNLFVNAKQAIEDKGTISITTRSRDNKVFITFEDDGGGIPEENLKRIFDPGYTTRGVGVGTGLGLSICYQIIQDHRGEIKVKSVVGKGTTFDIILPLDLESIIEREKLAAKKKQ
ncbi:PAS domain S-box protein [Acidobacteriota bacterium]